MQLKMGKIAIIRSCYFLQETLDRTYTQEAERLTDYKLKIEQSSYFRIFRGTTDIPGIGRYHNGRMRHQ